MEGNSGNGADNELPKKRSPPQQAKRAAKKRRLQSGAAEGPEASQAAWSTLAEEAGLLVSILKTAGKAQACMLFKALCNLCTCAGTLCDLRMRRGSVLQASCYVML